METVESENPMGFWPMIVLLYDVDTLGRSGKETGNERR